MANSRKKISELPALSVASLDTTFVLGISGSTTYKISINNLTSSLDTTFATDLVTNALSSSLNSKLSTSSFNSYTSSFTASVASGTISGSSQLTSSFDTRYVVSGSITQTTWDNIANKPAGIVSQSTDLSSLNTFTQSIDSRVDSLENSTGSYLTSLSGAISSSSQLTSSFDIRYTLSGSITETTWNNISGKPSGIVSQSTDLTSLNQFTQSIDGRVDSLENTTSSFETKGSGIISGAAQITSLGYSKLVGGNTFYNEQTFLSNVNIQGNLSSSVINNLNVATASLVTSITNLNSATSSYLTSLSGAISSSSQLTSSYDLRYTTTGSNTFKGEQIISSSLIVTNAIKGTGSIFLQPDINDSRDFRIYNTAPSDIHIKGNAAYSFFGDDTNYLKIDDNTGITSIVGVNGVFVSSSLNVTGSLNVTSTTTLKGAVTIGTGSGAEGGEISLAYAQTTSLTGTTLAVDVYQDRLRIFEGGGNNRGAYLNVASQSNSVGSSIVTSPNLLTMQTITSASYAALTPISGTLYIIIG